MTWETLKNLGFATDDTVLFADFKPNTFVACDAILQTVVADSMRPRKQILISYCIVCVPTQCKILRYPVGGGGVHEKPKKSPKRHISGILAWSATTWLVEISTGAIQDLVDIIN
jgi:hypothetical protein